MEKNTRSELFDPSTDKIEQHTAICHSRNTLLTAGLIAMGVPLREDPPFSHVKGKNGHDIFTYNFHPSTVDGMYNTSELIGLWKNDLDFIADEERKEARNPDYIIHPWARVITALKNYQDLLEGQSTNRPFVPFGYLSQHGPIQMVVQEGTRRHKAAIDRGYTPL